jgi:hypothetical protein
MSSLELQGAIVARLKADATLAAIIGTRVYDLPPAAPTFPYVTLGEDQTIPDRGDGYEGSDVSLTLHAWSKGTGFPEVKRMVAAIRASLTNAPLSLSGHRLVNIEFEDSRVLRDPDPAISHGVLTFLARTEPA